MNLRPTHLIDIIGQKNVKERLEISINACKSTGEQLPHTLFYGPPGTGKSTLAQALANELGLEIQIANGANIRSIKALLPYLMRIKSGSILFIDEIHRLPIMVAEFLYVAIEEFRVDLGKKGQMSIKLPEFTFVGATTNAGSIPKPLYDRFILKLPLELYSNDDLVKIISISADKMNLCISEDAKLAVAKTSRSVPRIANNRLKWIRHYAISNNINIVEEKHIISALALEGVNKDGVDKNDLKYIQALKNHQPAGINTISSVTNIDKDTIEYVIEPFLLSHNVIKKTGKGRILCQSK